MFKKNVRERAIAAFCKGNKNIGKIRVKKCRPNKTITVYADYAPGFFGSIQETWSYKNKGKLEKIA